MAANGGNKISTTIFSIQIFLQNLLEVNDNYDLRRPKLGFMRPPRVPKIIALHRDISVQHTYTMDLS